MQEPIAGEPHAVPPPAHTVLINPAANTRRMRRIIAEDPEWSLAIVPQLTELCIQHIINNFEKNPILNRLIPEHQKKVLEKLPTNLPLTVTANLVRDEGYWKRCCTERWTVCDVSQYGGSWKQMFFERHLENILKFYIPDTTSPNQVLDIIPLCKKYVKKLEINQFLPPVKQDQKKEDEDISDTESDAGIDEPSMDHFDLSMLVPALCHLEELHLTYDVKDCGMNFEWNLFEFTLRDCWSLATALKKCLTLKVFKLTRSKVDDEKARILIRHLLDHTSLIELNLSHNLLADRAARAIGKLINRSKLVSLNLCDNRIRAQGGQAIAHALSKNDVLTSLNLRLNCIEDEGGQAICHALLVNNTLTTVHLGGNELSEPTATLFSQVLAQNTALTHINLSCNHIGLGRGSYKEFWEAERRLICKKIILSKDGGKQLLEGMTDNKTVVEFDLRLAEVGQESEYLINQAIKTNQELARLKSLQCQTSMTGQSNVEEKHPELD